MGERKMTVTIPYEFNPEYCIYRLPCGICERTNNICPLQKNGYKIDYTRPTTVSTGTGYSYTVKSEENETNRCR